MRDNPKPNNTRAYSILLIGILVLLLASGAIFGH